MNLASSHFFSVFTVSARSSFDLSFTIMLKDEPWVAFMTNFSGRSSKGISSGMGTCGMVGPIGVYTGWVNDVASGAKAAITAMDWIGLLLIAIVLPAVICQTVSLIMRRLGIIKPGDLKL